MSFTLLSIIVILSMTLAGAINTRNYILGVYGFGTARVISATITAIPILLFLGYAPVLAIWLAVSYWLWAYQVIGHLEDKVEKDRNIIIENINKEEVEE